MTNRQKILFLGVVPIVAALIGGIATYFGTPAEREQILITGEAAKAAKDGKLTIEIIRSDESDYSWMAIFIFPLMIFGFAAFVWALVRD